MNKGENHLKGGSVTVKIYPRIKADELSYGRNYHERSKTALSFYRQEWQNIREELETPAYFRRKLIRNYLYKGPVLEWYTRIKLRLERNYELINQFVPRRARIMDIGCGYGFLSHMLGFVSADREIVGIDYDAEKIEMAGNCISKQNHVNFVAADATSCPFQKSDVFILSDMLHYLPEDKQASLLMRCIENLNPGGVILIRDADKDLEKRHLGTRYTEFFSTRTGFNKADHHRLYFFSGRKIQELASEQCLQLEIIDNTRLTSNILYVLRK
jgi:2-polyprenyl-3-methyl-5-hydroxy-6-metoxy-1,4-benzoquinol methylase